MRLGLCSGALPDASLGALLESAARRGLSVLELRDGDGHGVDPARPLAAASMLERARASGVAVVGYRDTTSSEPLHVARLGRLTGRPILVDGPLGLAARLERAGRIGGRGASVAVVVSGPRAAEDARAVRREGLAVAWDAAPEDDLGQTLASLLDEAGAHLRHIRLHGGGPEAGMHEGKGIGEMTGRLALAGYDGTLILTPSSPRYRIAWQTWLGRRGGWGCGSKSANEELVTLGGAESWRPSRRAEGVMR